MPLRFSTNLQDMNIDMIHGFLSASYWSEFIPLVTVKKSMENSLCFGCFSGDEQVGFGRAVTDYTTFAYLADIFIIETEQGKGYGKQLMEYIMSHSELQGLKRWHLVTRDAQPLYKQFGFAEVRDPVKHMEIRVDDIYKKQ